ncbi:formate--phosphoribosylaminoimidazolecarboxamide ligase [Stetteria hydrogenophila]
MTVATLASHSALQILHGASKEGFRTAVIGPAERLRFYANFKHFIDEFIEVPGWSGACTGSLAGRLRGLNAILVPHGSAVEYLGPECMERIEVPIFGLRSLVRVEADQRLKLSLLREAGIPVPRSYEPGESFEGLIIVKLPGAKGGRGYFLSRDPGEVAERLEELARRGVIESPRDALIQEYVVGVPAYYHFFYSPILGRLEIMGADVRYESNVDGLRRLPPSLAEGVEPSFVVAGNIPLVMRESLLPRIMEYGERFVEATRRRLPPGVIGPFSLESVVTENLDIVVFEFSGRIVAGTNLYITGSPYSALYWDEPMSTGRRIAREIRLAASQGRLADVVT